MRGTLSVPLENDVDSVDVLTFLVGSTHARFQSLDPREIAFHELFSGGGPRFQKLLALEIHSIGCPHSRQFERTRMLRAEFIAKILKQVYC